MFVHICIWHEHLDHCMQDGTRVDFHSSSCTKKSSLVDWRAVVWVHNRSDPKLAHHYLESKEWQDIACKMYTFLMPKLSMWHMELKIVKLTRRLTTSAFCMNSGGLFTGWMRSRWISAICFAPGYPTWLVWKCWYGNTGGMLIVCCCNNCYHQALEQGMIHHCLIAEYKNIQILLYIVSRYYNR